MRRTFLLAAVFLLTASAAGAHGIPQVENQKYLYGWVPPVDFAELPEGNSNCRWVEGQVCRVVDSTSCTALLPPGPGEHPAVCIFNDGTWRRIDRLCIDEDSDGNCEVARFLSFVVFDPDDDGVGEFYFDGIANTLNMNGLDGVPKMVTGLAAPSVAADTANKGYVDGLVRGTNSHGAARWGDADDPATDTGAEVCTAVGMTCVGAAEVGGAELACGATATGTGSGWFLAFCK